MTKQTTFEHPPGKHMSLLAYDSANDTWRAAYVDASGNLQVDANVDFGSLLTELQQKLETADVLLDAGKRLGVNLYGWDGTAARKLGLVWGYSDRLYENIVQTAVGAVDDVYTTAVPSGYVHVMRFYSFYHNDTVARSGDFTLYAGSTQSTVVRGPASISPSVWYSESIDVSLAPGDKMRWQMGSMTAGKTLYLRIWGYKMQIDQ